MQKIYETVYEGNKSENSTEGIIFNFTQLNEKLKSLSFISLPLDDFLVYRDEEMESLKRDFVQNILSIVEGYFNPQTNLEIWNYVEDMQKRYEHLEALFNDDEGEIHPLEVDSDD
ncbi:hypothetical protein KI387_002469, partial [Taxus chinensis]